MATMLQDTAPELRWERPAVRGEAPTRRSGHSLNLIGNNGFLFGGLDHSLPPGPTNQLYQLRMVNDEFHWLVPHATGTPPPPRWRHSAVVWERTKIVYFGGFFSSSCRHNDLWVFNSISLSWSQPVEPASTFDADGNHVTNDGGDPHTPPPRGAHSASIVGHVMYVFGGYGGTGFGRRDFNDLYGLNLEEMRWQKLAPKGKPPEPRSGHSANVVEFSLVVYGGWNAHSQFKDMFVLDTDSLTWSQAEVASRLPRWNHSAVSVEAIPNWKLFVFGGSAGDLTDTARTSVQGAFQGDMMIMDVGEGDLVWSSPAIDGTPPKPRADAALAYDAKGSRLVLFGGWANRWFDDLFTLNVEGVVGPPYAVMDVDPKVGPITGGSTVTIIGIDFFNTTDVVVRFGNKKHWVDVPGEYHSDTEITCDAPNFETFGAGTVDVRVALKGDSFTTTFQRYTFFSVTDANYCLAFGPGLIDGGLAGKAAQTNFIIQARDCNNQPRTTGGDEFDVFIRSSDGTAVQCELHDNEDGSYAVYYAAPLEDTYSISVSFRGTFGGVSGPIRGSPFSATLVKDVPKSHNKMGGPLVLDKLKADLKQLTRFTNGTMEGLRQPVPEDDIDTLIRVKEHLLDVTEKDDEVLLAVDRIHAVIAWLQEREGVQVPVRVEAGVAAAMDTWAQVKKQVPVTKGQIAPLVKVHGYATRVQLTAYDERIQEYSESLNQAAFWRYATGIDHARLALDEAEARQELMRKEFKQQQHLASMFDMREQLAKTAEAMDSVDDRIQWMRELWDMVDKCVTYFTLSRQMLWAEVDADVLEETAKSLLKEVNNHLNTAIRPSDAFQGLIRKVKNFLSTCPLILALHHPSMRARHWQLLQTATGQSFTPPPEDPSLKLEDLLALNLHNYSADVEEITDQALKEAKMEVTLAKLDDLWTRKGSVNWVAEPYKEGTPGYEGVSLVKMDEDDFELMENDQLQVQAMVSSRYLSTFEKEVLHWQRSLRTIADVVALIGDIQRVWSYLEPLFVGSDEVKRELPADAERFATIDTNVRDVLRQFVDTANVMESCCADGVQARLEGISEQLELCKKSLADFLDGKRRVFPRFYFVSEADLLDILSNGSNPASIMQHITKVFLATATLELQGGDGLGVATRFVAGVGVERLAFDPAVVLSGKVEEYLSQCLHGMQTTLRSALKRSYDRYDGSRVEWLMAKQRGATAEGDADGSSCVDPAQIAVLVASMKYVEEVERAFVMMERGNASALKDFNDVQTGQLTDLIRLTRTPLSKADRMRVMVCITMDAHARDVIARLVHEGVDSVSAFQWQSQLKQRLRDGAAVVQVADASFNYGYEYLGNGPRLVITPLTDRIYVTATQALNLKMGCAPAGPAGTGKTETTKDLASALGKVCYVFNCSPEMDYQSMGNIFKGLAASGSWGCFDEFNRLVPEVLSVCSVQFKAVCDGIRQKRSTVAVEGDEVTLDPTCGTFITMNPGYLGRSELPEGLKTLFRPITVMVPDLVLICENMLMAEGFEDAKTLAYKFYGLYSLLRELLSKQSHYDWGLRAVKSVLVVAGGFKRAEPDLPEQALLMRALRDFNTPKIVRSDEVVFFGLLRDLFPGVDPPRRVDPDLEAAVTEAAQGRGLWPEESFRLKVVQLEEVLAIRHCVFLMGPAGAGKSECWRTLAAAQDAMGSPTLVKDVNPKAITPEELYGYVLMATREWKEGLLSTIMRDLGRIRNTDWKWIVLDGDLDANWIESMNSVMDDNKMLTLANNERIPLKPHMRMIFEIRDLAFATPATVSRAGIIYISTDDGVQWRNMVAAWISHRKEPDSVKTALSSFFDTYVAAALLHMKKALKPLVPMEDTALVAALLRCLEVLLPHPKQQAKHANKAVAAILRKRAPGGGRRGSGGGAGAGAGSSGTPEYVIGDVEEVKHAPSDDVPLGPEEVRALEQLFVFATVWAVGSCLSEKDGEDMRKRFSDHWKATCKAVRFPSRDTVFDYYLHPDSGKLEPWKNSPFFYSIEYNSSTPMSQVTVPTPETCSVMFWLQLLTAARQPVMLVGNAGCGKTQLVNGLLTSLRDSAATGSTTINFNFYTNAASLQLALETPLEKKAGHNFGPAGGFSRMVFFLDDLNLPEVDPYNTQSAIALLRQHVDYGHWFDRHKLTLKNINDCQYVAAMNPAAGSFLVNPRLQRHFSTFAIGFPGATSLLTIYQTFLDGHLRHFDDDIQSLSSHLINGALSLHTAVSAAFRKTAKNFHYEFNIRHLSNVFQGLLMAQPGQFKDPAKFVQLWVHESERVYGDRLVSAADLQKFRALLLSQARKRFPQYNMGAFFATENASPLLFCHFSESIHDKMYDQITDLDHLNGLLVTALAEYNEMHATMDLVLFNDAMHHVCRISRIVLNPAGHALLVGVGGSGKQSLARLAAFICGYSVSQIVISGAYGLTDLRDDLKLMYHKAGVKDEGVMFLFTDSQITNERFLVLLNDLLASGDIPDLYTTEEKDNLVGMVAGKVKAAGLPQDRSSCWSFFLNQARKNLHVCLCFSPVGDALRTRALRFPALVSCTVIDWFQPWPTEALLSVGRKMLSNIKDLGSPSVRSAIERFMPYSFDSVNRMAARFNAVEKRHVYTTPKSYLELLSLYRTLLEKRRETIGSDIRRLSNGLKKLRTTGDEVASIEKDLKVLLEGAEEKRLVAEGIAEQVAEEREQVAQEREAAAVETHRCEEIQAEVSAKQRDTEEDLAKAEPAVVAAMAALETLNKKDLGECKTMTTPPNGVDDVFAAVVVLLAGVEPNVVTQKNGKVRLENRSWDAAKRALLTNLQGFVDTLKGFRRVVDSFAVPSINWREVRPYLALPHFKKEVIERKNVMAAGLCAWVINIVTYHDILEEVEPKRKALAEANEKLALASEKLARVQAKLAGLEEKLAKLTVRLEQAEAEKEEAIAEVNRGTRKLELAQRLIKALADENVRWAEGVDQLNAQRRLLVGDVLLASAFISYIGPFTHTYRRQLLEEQWVPYLRSALGGDAPGTAAPTGAATSGKKKALSGAAAGAGVGAGVGAGAGAGVGAGAGAGAAGGTSSGGARPSTGMSAVTPGAGGGESDMPMSATPNPLDVLTSEVTIAEWNSQGLPSDAVSTENGAISCNTSRWPLLIDPQLQGIAWIREREGSALAVGRLTQPDLVARLSTAITEGTPFLIENMGERVDAVLWPVISRATFRKGHRRVVRLGDDELELHPQFRLYLHTKLSNPHYPPEVQAETTLINFAVTQVGLEEQLLSLVVRKERPDLANQRSVLLAQQNQYKIEIKQLEDQILAKLAAAEGDVTQDEELINSLEEAKRLANEVAAKMKVADETQTTIQTTAEQYRSVAARGAVLFFIMNSLDKVHTYYMFSLNAFVVVFLRGIEMADDRTAGAVSAAGTPTPPTGKTPTPTPTPPPGPMSPAGSRPAGGRSFKKMANVARAVKQRSSKRFKWNADLLRSVQGIDGDGSEEESKARALSSRSLTALQLKQRCTDLRASVTSTVFNYVRRGLFDTHKLLIASLLCFKIMVTESRLHADAFALLLNMGATAQPTAELGIMGPLVDWMPEAAWAKVKQLEAVAHVYPAFASVGEDMQNDSDFWQLWFDSERPELEECPNTCKDVSSFERLLLLRALRPDRLTAALTTFVGDEMGRAYVTEQPFSMASTFEESSPSTPVFFVLFPGVDPTTWVEALGRDMGMTSEAGKFLNISMGQGQEAPAEAALASFARSGGWIMLQNVHLMQSWLPALERQLEVCAETADPDFRCFISGEPPPLAFMKNVPESLLQSCIKVANEAPADLKSNLTRAWSNFSEDRLQACSKPEEFKTCLFALCFFHSIVLGRRRFGHQGWSRPYSFNTGDLVICADVLQSYLDSSPPDVVPWDDLRYIFGEIMYGGHITDAWDRRTNNTYLEVFFNPDLLEGGDLAPFAAYGEELPYSDAMSDPGVRVIPGFPVPDPCRTGFRGYLKYISKHLPTEAPQLFGLHPNSEIGYLNNSADFLLKSLLLLEGPSDTAAPSASSSDATASSGTSVKSVIEQLLQQLPEEFALLDLRSRAEPLLKQEAAPFVVVVIQECTRMNALLAEIRRSLVELRKGLDGQLNMSEPMEDLAAALAINEVPGRNPFHKCSWERLAWFSNRALAPWFQDLIKRAKQLADWSVTLELPLCLWLPGLFNPTAFLTAIMQVTARRKGYPLDNMTVETHVTTVTNPSELERQPVDGVYVHGLQLEGAQWAKEDEAGNLMDPYTVSGTECAGYLMDSMLKQLLPPVPVMYVKAVTVEPSWSPTSVGYLRHDPAIYDCPVYFTRNRGPTYVFLATLRSQEDTAKWVLAGVALVLQSDH